WIGGAPHDVRIKRIDESVALGVVAEQGLAHRARHADTASQQRRQFVADLLAQGAEPPAQEVRHVGLENELIEIDAVQPQLLLEHAPHLPRAAADEADAMRSRRAACRAQLAQERRRTWHRTLVLGALECRAQKTAQGLELSPQIGLV